MQHLYDFLNSKRIPVEQILSSTCYITEKIDGSAFQYSNDNGNIKYAKRGNTLNNISSNNIDDFDLLLTPMYSNAYEYIESVKEKIPSSVKILNFEVFDSYNKHLISYPEFKHDMILLSGYDHNNVICNGELQKIADNIDIQYNNTLWTGNFLYSDIRDLIVHKNEYEYLWDVISKYVNINKDNIEGYVMTFPEYNRVLKVQNPKFHNDIIQHLSDEKKNKNINLENIYDLFINQYTVHSEYKHPISKLLELYFATEVCSKDLYDIEKNLKELEILSNIKINIKQAKKFYDLFPDSLDDIMYPEILKFILLVFRNKRSKYPLWCSLDYQCNVVNKFLETYIFNE